MLNLKAYNQAQCNEIEAYIWCRGVELGHDPTQDKPRELWALEWALRFHAEFAEHNRKKYEVQDGDN